jgi:hypothetical protein
MSTLFARIEYLTWISCWLLRSACTYNVSLLSITVCNIYAPPPLLPLRLPFSNCYWSLQTNITTTLLHAIPNVKTEKLGDRRQKKMRNRLTVTTTELTSLHIEFMAFACNRSENTSIVRLFTDLSTFLRFLFLHFYFCLRFFPRRWPAFMAGGLLSSFLISSYLRFFTLNTVTAIYCRLLCTIALMLAARTQVRVRRLLCWSAVCVR